MSWRAARDLGHSDEPHVPSLGFAFCGVAEPEFSPREEESRSRDILHFPQLSAFRLKCAESDDLVLGNLRRNGTIKMLPETRNADSRLSVLFPCSEEDVAVCR